MVYQIRPPKGSVGRLAWDWYVHEHNRAPESVEYTSSHDYQNKGWICEHLISNVFVKHMNYGGSSNYVFYPSSYLVDKKDEILAIEYVEPSIIDLIEDKPFPSVEEVQQFHDLMGGFTERVRALYKNGVKLFDARRDVLQDLGYDSIDEYLAGNGCNVVASHQPRDPASYSYRCQ